MSKKKSGWSEYIRFFPFINAMLVLGLYGTLYNLLTLCRHPKGICKAFSQLKYKLPQLIDTVVPQYIEAMRTRAFAGRIAWTMSVGLTILMSLLGTVVVIYIFYRSRRYYSGRLFRWVIIYIVLPLILGSAIYLILAGFGGGKDPWRFFLHSALKADVRIAEGLTDFLDAWGTLLAIYFAAAAVSLLAPFSDKTKKWKFELRVHYGNLKLLLYVGSILLMVNTLRSAALLNWSLDYIDQTMFIKTSMEYFAYQGLHPLVVVMVAARGLLYSCIVFALYLPAAAFLKHEAEIRTVEENLSKEERKTWLAEFGTLSGLAQIGAVLSPILGGLLTEFLLNAFI